MLVQKPRGGSSLKIVAAVLGVLAGADLIARIPFGSLFAGPDPAASSTTGAAETAATAVNPPPSATQPELAAAKQPQAAPSPRPQTAGSEQRTSAAAPAPKESAARETDVKNAESLPCEQQTWPYLDSRCKDTNVEAPPAGSREVRVIGKESTAPATVVTPIPPEANTPQRSLPRETNKSNAAAEVTNSNAPAQPAASVATNVQPTDNGASAIEPSSRSLSTGAIALPRPAPEAARKVTAAEPEQSVKPSVPANFAVQENPRKFDHAARRAAKAASPSDAPAPRKKLTSKRRSGSDAEDSEGAPGSREQASLGAEEYWWKREGTLRRGSADARRNGITQSRAYQLPSGRRIVVFRQSNGDVGIAPDTGSGSFFFGR